ncbi:NFX1-type zinc finger-containing protein 1-like [Mizuhopecten yessoensis]|uniref:NFX1-type zinc finger-containing protein 1-like n=1 Tax=Mizuhopecten yessoensis TaxID=6573 RepID=UPI000B45DC3D|nr:NFX1-type zinc finger-containing protein 1-like [Mizuhopecten yessoensis]XP_021369418.1 NFX1-type zinc finger-containing protein 1-like [Mizuhopecten yessoensis]XP_021369419.1 NFX1-type zinc finger-containing protein 1-like [Mizuhopecten yessoensis]
MALARSDRTFSVGRLKSLLDESCSNKKVLDTLVSHGRSRALVSFDTSDLPPADTICWLAVIAKAVQCVTDKAKVIDLLTMVLGTRLFTREITNTLSMFASNTSEDDVIQFIQNLVEVVSQLFLRFPHSFTDVFGHIVIMEKRIEEMILTTKGKKRQKIQSLSDVVSSLKETALKRMTGYDRGKAKSECLPPPEDFRTIPVLPRTSDIFVNYRGVYLRKNKASGGYENLEHYLDVQFRLYREDCISPLRDGVNEYITAVSSGNNIGRLQDGKLYKKVVAVSKKPTIEGEQYVIKLDKDQSSRINWMSSRRLIYGSLVCLSVDNFRNMHFAVVSESDRKDLQKDRKFSVVCPCNDILPLETKMTMVESSAYFEAYRHVLAGLQNIKEGELPFEKYIVKCRKDVDPPLYVMNTSAEYDLQPILSGQPIYNSKEKATYYKRFAGETDGENKDSGKQHNVKILQPIYTWPTAEELCLDQSQLEAFHAALTQELVLIQGPPGTGKTHVGLKIAKTLLHNKSTWETPETKNNRIRDKRKCPMLVVCFTNHALDQFMEGIVNFLDPKAKLSWRNDIVRVGGRSDNAAVEQFSLKNRRRSFGRGGRVDENRYFRSLQRLQQQIADTKYRLRNLHSVILKLTFLKPIMSGRNCKALDKENIFFEWLGADEMSWMQKAEIAYYSELQTLYSGHAGLKTRETQNQQELLHVKTDAEILEDDRRIEDDTLASLEADKDIGLDVRIAISNMLHDDSDVCKTLQMDDLFKAVLRQEAMKTFTRLTSHDTMTDWEAAGCSSLSNLNNLTLDNRWRLYRYWVRKYKASQEDALLQLEQELSQVLKDYQKEKKCVDAMVLKTATVIAMTTTGAARYQDVLKEIGPRIVIIEEAAEVLETHIITALSPRCEHLILIGDHKQLEPKPSVYRLEQKYNLGLSMFERLLNNGIENHCLQRQHRMRPDISRLVRDIYPTLEDSENVFKYEHVMGVEKDVFFINHNRSEDYGGDTRSYSNKHEAGYVVALCRYLLKQGYAPNQITILAAYSGQMLCIRNLMPRNEFEGVRAVAIDNFQGEETDIILLSLVRSNKTGNIGFLKKENRICVALSRAKKGLYVIGDFSILEAGCHLWAQVTKKTKLFDQFGNALPLVCQNHPQTRTLVTDAEDFNRSPDGGCDRKCDFRLCCGHVCRLFCHPKDKEHIDYKCKETCNKACSNDHQCRKKCHFEEECKCPILMKKDLPCGHKATMKCHIHPEDHKCTVNVEKTLPCGHVLTLQCNSKPESILCKEFVNRTLGRCGHDAIMECSVNPDTFKCRILVTHTLERCVHEVTLECHVDATAYQCKRIVTRELHACEHTAELECWINSAHHECTVMLHKFREDCGHSFDVVCSKYSPSYESDTCCSTITSKRFSKCQHSVDVACHIDIKNIKCKAIVKKQWDCQHSAELECCTSEEANCKQKCLQKCTRGHICYRKCHYPEQCTCKRWVDKTIPNCCHIQKVECHKDPGSVDCTEIVIKELPHCAHIKKMPCHEDPSTIVCVQMVNKALIPCGHMKELECSSDVSMIKCIEIVSKRIELCGHSQDMACSMDPSSCKCTSLVNKVLPQCGHISKLECSADPEHHLCDEIVSKKLPCDHEIKMECCKSPSTSTRCQVMVRMSRPACSHKVDIECSKKASIDKKKCNKLTQQQLACGHDCSVECWKSVNQQPCQQKCSATLSCGHKCGGKCRNCSVNMFHEPCKKSCNKILICGHSCNSTKCGSCRSCNSQCKNYCPHRHCTHACGSECRPCHEKCSLKCPHHQCSRLCFEQCDRPRCDRPCPLLLDCQHRCLGFCGDPCPESCIKCKTKHIQKVFCHTPPSEDTRLVRLTDCRHEFESNYLDEIVDGKTNALDIFRCPKCKEIVRWHPRYANVLKIQWEAIESVKTFLNMHVSLPRISFPKETEDIAKAAMYITRFRTYLYIQEKLHNGTTDVRLLNQWAISYSQMLTKLLYSSQQTIDLTPQQVGCINRNLCKLSAVWLLLISSHWENRSASCELKVDTRTSGRISDGKRIEYITEEHKTVNDAESFIRKAHTFTTSNLHKVRKMLEPLLTNASEAIVAFDFPVLVAVGVHRDDWTICDKGHFRPSNIWSKTCSECSSENLIKQHGLDVGGACGGDEYGTGQGGRHGRGRGQSRFNEGSKRDRGRGSRGRCRDRGLERSSGFRTDCRKLEDTRKKNILENSGQSREKGDKKTGRECCGEIVEGNGKMRGREVEQHNKINEKVTDRENKIGCGRGETDVGSRGGLSRGGGRQRGGGSKRGRGKEIGKENGKRSLERHGRGTVEQQDESSKRLRGDENVGGNYKGRDRDRDSGSGGKGGRRKECCEESEGSRHGNIKGMSGREFEGVPSREVPDGKRRGRDGELGGERGGGYSDNGGGGGSKGKGVEKNKRGRGRGEHSEGGRGGPYSGHRGGRGRGSRGGRGRGSKVESGAEGGKVDEDGSCVWNEVERGGGRGRGRGRGSRGGRGGGNRGGRSGGNG